jgi:DNA-binding winged helix-turn-helix (wHTH) protein
MRLAFGDCVFDSGTHEVFRGGRPSLLSPKAFALLDLLIARRPNAVSKEEIHERLWPGTFVSDASLANLVAELRGALDDDARRPRIIRTVPRYGYAFCAAGSAASPGRARPSPYRLIWKDREIALAPGENLLGRDEDAVVWIDDAKVSRRHARIVIGESNAVLEDLGSRNGTRLHGERIRSAVELADGDLITIGSASFLFRVFQKTASTASAAEETPKS